MNQPTGQKLDLRSHMPHTAKWVADKRKEFGAEHVNACIRRSINGEAGCFYAIEAGRVLGTPFPPTAVEAKWQDYAVITGCSFAAFICPPPSQEAAHGAD